MDSNESCLCTGKCLIGVLEKLMGKMKVDLAHMIMIAHTSPKYYKLFYIKIIIVSPASDL